MRQVSVTISDFTHSTHAGGAILSLYDSLQPSVSNFFKIFIEKCNKNCSQSMQTHEITLLEALRQLKRIFLNLHVLFLYA